MSSRCPSCGEENSDQARFCSTCAAALPSAESAREERKLATVLFADLVGSTAMADEQDPEQTRLVLNRFYDAMTEEVERCGGTVEKFAGDAVMAAFGAPAALEDHAERALHAALAMHQRLAGLFGGRLALRIGVNTGEVIVGRPREGSSFVTGDAVNVAARLEQAAGPGETMAGQRTVNAAQGAFEFSEPRTIEAKGKAGGVASRLVLRALSLMRPRGVRGLPSVFVGRDVEFTELQARYAEAVGHGAPRLVSILGDAGVGKSRLTREMWAWLGSQSPTPLRRVGRTLSYGKGTTYWPMAEILKEHFGISEGEAAESMAAKLGDRPYLGLTLGIAPPDEEIHPLVARERLHDAWVALMDELVRDAPVVLLVEDVHWAEDQLCELLDTLVAQVQGPLLVLATARPELLDRRPAWGGARGRTSAMRLDALPTGDTRLLLGRLLGIEVPEQIASLVVERAEGNPFFVEELIATLIDRGVLTRDNGAWAFTALPTGFALPDSVQAVLAARIDRLAVAEKAGLQAAAVIGRTFWTGPMYELVRPEHPTIGVLEEREFVRRHPASTLPGEREYAFKHMLTREVAYGSLPRARRARLHAAFAEWLERWAGGQDESAPLLAHHYAMAVRPEDLELAWAGHEADVDRIRASAVHWLRKAADLAVSRYEIDDAVSLRRRAVELTPDASVQAQLWFEIGHASALKYDGEGFVAALERALELGAPGDEVYPELAYQTSMRAGMWQRRLDDSLVDGWIARALAETTPGSRQRARALLARSNWHSDLAAGREALALAEVLGDPALRSDGLGAVANSLEAAGQIEEARDVLLERIGLLPAVQDPDQVADAFWAAGNVHLGLGRMAEARAFTERAQETAAGLTPHHRVHGFTMRGLLEIAAGAWQDLRQLEVPVTEEVEANLSTPCPFNVGLPLILAVAAARTGDADQAAVLVARAEAIGMVGYERILSPYRLQLALARRNLDEIRRIVDSVQPDWRYPGASTLWAGLFDGLAFLGDRGAVEADAPQWLEREAIVAPFAMRALGAVRGDPELVAAAADRFGRMGLEWRAQETRDVFASLETPPHHASA